ncbi:MAG: ribonuclease H family protein [Porphyromonadaceae bacterium]|nr:ribonuclease H family protein [Porphyromonadaceae bacterium]
MAQNKYYVVWQGFKPGIYTSWEECRKQVSGFENARYKSFPSREEAARAFLDNPWKHLNTKKGIGSAGSLPNAGIIKESLAVDAACSGNPGLLEYRGVYIADNREIFHMGPLEEGTNNVGEFLAIVHALALLKKQNQNIPVYSDSMNAIKWVTKKKCNTKLEQSEKNRLLFELITRAEIWLQNNSYENPILKWETKQWGEIPADFGRK